MHTTTFRILTGLVITVIVLALFFGPRFYQGTEPKPDRFGFGRAVSALEVAQWDIDVRPDGKGLPAGQGTVARGRIIYSSKCASCHAADGREIKGVKLPGPPLVSDTLAGSKPKTIGNYWPYASTLFDYIRRTMPYNAPGSLSDEEVYSVTAFLLNANSIINEKQLINQKNLPLVHMPATKLFIKDTRKGGNEVR
jgi:mono/diheme cytochrome c family protein